MAAMKTMIATLLTGALVLGCSPIVNDETDPYDKAANEEWENEVPKGDGPESGAAGALGLPSSASCPVIDGEPAPIPETDPETDPMETDPETDPMETDPETDPMETDPETDPMETDPVDETDAEVEDPCAEALADSPWAPVYDLDAEHVDLGNDLRSPDTYPRPRVAKFGMGGSEYWQKWPGGKGPLFGYPGGSEQGRRCMAAAALRFQLLLADPPESMMKLKETTRWNGSFFNWVDDFSNENSWGSASGARLWAWRTGLIKFISQTDTDGTCYLPTRSMMESLAEDCLERAESSDGAIQGCRS
jgi:hypothetical protein